MTALLVTNDFPPKVGGIQSYLWELWRRLPPEQATVLTTRYPGAPAFDAGQAFRVERAGPVLLPTPVLRRRIRTLAADVGALVVVLDPALPVGMVGPFLDIPYAVVLHGAEVTVPGRLPGTRAALGRVLRGAVHVVAAGRYPAAEAGRAVGAGAMPPVTVVPPGVDGERFRPLTPESAGKARADLGLPQDAELVVGVSRLVPRKGMDTLVRAAALLAPGHPDLVVAVAGKGRDLDRLRRLAVDLGAPVRFLGRVPDELLPALYGCADVFAAPCRSRWRGLEQEGFGIVFLEAAACGVPQVAGDSGGAAEAVADGRTGVVVRRPSDASEVAAAIAGLIYDPARRRAMGQAARRRALEHFSYDRLAATLSDVLTGLGR